MGTVIHSDAQIYSRKVQIVWESIYVCVCFVVVGYLFLFNKVACEGYNESNETFPTSDRVDRCHTVGPVYKTRTYAL